MPGGGFVIADCYNANPVSMRAALRHLVAGGGRPPHRRRAGRDGRARAGRAGPARRGRPRGRSGSASTSSWRSARSAAATAAAGTPTRGAAAGRARRRAAARRRGAREGQPLGGARGGRGGAHVKLVLAAGVVAMLLGIVSGPALHRLPAPQRVRPAHPRGRPGRAPSPSRARRRWAASACSACALLAFVIFTEHTGPGLAVAGTALACAAIGLPRRLPQADAAALARPVAAAGSSCCWRSWSPGWGWWRTASTSRPTSTSRS